MMELLQTCVPLSATLIRQLLTPAGRSQMPEAFAWLMQVYCVVKAGGVVAQVAIAQRLEATERPSLLAEVAALQAQGETQNRIAALQWELKELARSIDHRLQFLQAISPAEEALVREFLPEIEATLQLLAHSR
jgi:hypothetical protein